MMPKRGGFWLFFGCSLFTKKGERKAYITCTNEDINKDVNVLNQLLQQQPVFEYDENP
jgi:hypothetical protein